jgi:hypothetical protein
MNNIKGNDYMDTKESNNFRKTFGFIKGAELFVRIRSPPIFPPFTGSGGGLTPARTGDFRNKKIAGVGFEPTTFGL